MENRNGEMKGRENYVYNDDEEGTMMVKRAEENHIGGCLANPDAKRLYDDLLSNYNRLIRPVGNNSEKLIVKLGLKLSQLIDVVSVSIKVERVKRTRDDEKNRNFMWFGKGRQLKGICVNGMRKKSSVKEATQEHNAEVDYERKI
ncbi:hypothetical protein Pcinc_036964 [Petrolisthes cinctipes]|uniref:Neurotransmitter-gated ion-channel ligand-binding domain-containing protein n=1 Tax=Petrolisthes cinctipes TaxID=88211 RepID=A0AAE1BWL9_PETCI|nr:hypothetical protein Pcinc_036964 [Petrolisthes cinctipes]